MTNRLIRGLGCAVLAFWLGGCGDDAANAGDAGFTGNGNWTAQDFCNAYESQCGFEDDGNFFEMEDCLDDYSSKFEPAQQECVKGLLMGGASDDKCGDATGEGVCDD